jgi:hypothetical protein
MSNGNAWDLGDLITISGNTYVSGVLADPSHVEWHIMNPLGAVTTASALRSGTGIFWNNITANIAGTWRYQLSASGTVAGVGNGQFMVAQKWL